MKCLGRIITGEGYKLDTSNIKPLLELKDTQPKIVGDVRRLLGLLGYYRRHIKNFAQHAQPHYDLTKATKDMSSERKNLRSYGRAEVSSKVRIEWNKKHQEILEELIEHLISTPLMAY